MRFTLAFLFALIAVPQLAEAQRYPPLYPYGGYRYGTPESDLRIVVKPSDASVYVDGYFAGKVEDFDGVFQRLHTTPGQHEIVIYLEGHRSLRKQLYLSVNHTQKIEGQLEPLAAGEPQPPLPVPIARPEDEDPGRDPVRDPRQARPGRRVPPPQAGRPGDPRSDERPEPPPNSSRFGTLAIRVQPTGATVLVDDEHWTGPAGSDERLIIQVPEGRHHVVVERDGYEKFETDVTVDRGRTLPLNVSLTRTR